ncbi:aldo/keto reductase [Microbacterium murale]|uniref:Aryl-alcohol dehydrogenase-like predicted oxidoreductase n=1 Tax=Microbacterium murale TaxID=1081040 RepID=A0ABU0PBX9_9MICO|nr:aldo/keto reductase [Microbacterium murale]MDQ0644422.1 aryl-alcohol dehydrogenase-like predicted oxidoreductase [Microbacterium murale]
MTLLGNSDLEVLPLALGGNVFGWTADRDASFEILDAFTAGGGDFIDTADGYSAWVPGNRGGESETIIGEWIASRKPTGLTIATKVSSHPEFKGLSAKNIRAAAEASLKRLGVETIDLYYAHFDDAETPLEETVDAFGQLVTDGLVRHTAVSNYSPDRIRSWISLAQDAGTALPVAVQPHYSLVHRNDVEEGLIPVAEEFGLSLVPYYALASGFLTGKYRSTDASAVVSARAGGAAKYATPHGLAIIDELERIAAVHGASITSVSLAWLRSQPTVAAPIASASRVEQVADLLASATLELSAEDLRALDDVSAWSPANA